MRRTVHWIVAYIAVGLSAGLAAWSGVRGADASYVDASIKGLIMFVIAMLGCHGWAWAARMREDGHKGWAFVAWLILTVSLGVTLLGGAGAFYGAANERIAVAERGSDAYARADAAISAIEAKQKALTTHRSRGEIEPEMTSAEADPRFKASARCTPGKITLEETRQHCTQYRKLETELAAAKEDERLEALKDPHNVVVGKGRPRAQGGPGSILAVILGLTEERGNALFSLLCTIALDLGAVMALVTAELRKPHVSPPSTDSENVSENSQSVGISEPEPQRVVIPEPPKPRLAVSNPSTPIGGVRRILTEILQAGARQRVEFADIARRYRSVCRARGLKPVTMDEFVAEVEAFCKALGIKRKAARDHLYLLDVQLTHRVPTEKDAMPS